MARGIGRSGQFEAFRRDVVGKLAKASLRATDQAARAAREAIAEPLGKLGGAIGYGSDLKKGRGVHPLPGGGFRASGWVHIKGKSERTVGAVIAYTEGADIVPGASSFGSRAEQYGPFRGQWLWIATDEIPRRAGRYRMSPSRYNASGLANRIGPLVFVMGRHSGESLLIVRNVTTDRFGRPGKAKAFRGKLGSSREHRKLIVAFVGIRRTSRSARVDPRQILTVEQARLPDYRDAALGTSGR